MRIPSIRGARCTLMAMLGLAILAGPVSARAQPVAIPPTWGGDLLLRPRLTGNWLELRDDLAKQGVTIDIDPLLTPQAVAAGGRNSGIEFWGNADYTLNVDTGKLGLWPGGFLNVWADSGFGHNLFHASGAFVPVNTAALLPAPNSQTTALVNAVFTQFLSPKFGLFAGKVGTLNLMNGEFAGNYRTQFMNIGLSFPMNLEMVPISAYGGGIIVLPWESLALSAIALDPSGTPTNNDLGEAFEDGVMVLASAKATINPLGLVGHQSVGYMWSNKERFSLIQDPANLARALLTQQFPRLANPGPILAGFLQQFFPKLLIPVRPPNMKANTWGMYYGFDQYLWQPQGDAKRGVGIFFTFGASDGNPNPIQYFYSLGIGGNGVVPGRLKDNFGIGWGRTQFSDDFVPLLRQKLNLGLNAENAIELYYNAAMTRWLNTTLDLQIVDSALKKTLDSSRKLKDLNTALVVGLRVYVRL
jgi:porin